MPTPNSADGISAFRAFLTGLRPTGPKGVEGLVAAALSRFLGVVLTLSDSGEQYGIDMSGGPYVVQAKRYGRTALNKTSLIGEMTVAAKRRPAPQIWVLATLSRVSEQLATALEGHAAEAGIEVAILDWAETSRLLAVLIDQADATRHWLRKHCPHEVDIFEKAFAEVDIDAEEHRLALDDVRRQVSGIALAPALRRTLDAAYTEAFVDATGKRSKDIFGQVMALDDPKSGAIERTELLMRIDEALTSDDGRRQGIVVLGDEGVGKSWAIVDYWRRRARSRILVFVPSSLAMRYSESDDRWALLVAAVLQATETVASCDPRLKDASFLRRVIQRIADAKPEEAQRPLIVLDGLNERPSVNWTRTVHVQTRHFGTLILTCRPITWQSFRWGSRAIDLTPEEVAVPLFSDRELEAALSARGLDYRTITLDAMDDIRNPRLFGIAASIGMLGTERLSRERLFWEYWRHTGRRRAGTVLEPNDFNRFLIAQVSDVRASRVEKYRAGSPNFESFSTILDRCGLAGDVRLREELQEIATSGFFEVSPSETLGGHALSEGRIYYVIGLSLYSDLFEQWRRLADEPDPPAALALTIQTRMDAINALDETTASVATALLLSALDGPSSGPITRALAEYLLELRNARNEGEGLRYRHLFVEAACANVAPYIELAEEADHTDAWLAEALRAVHVSGITGRSALLRTIEMCWELEGRYELVERIIAGGDLTPFSCSLSSDLGRDPAPDVARPWIVFMDEASPRAAVPIAIGVLENAMSAETRDEFEASEDQDDDVSSSTALGDWDFRAFLEQWRALAGSSTAEWVPDAALPDDWQETLPPSLFADLDRRADPALPVFFRKRVSSGNPEGHSRFLQIVENRLLTLSAEERMSLLDEIFAEDGSALTNQIQLSAGGVALPSDTFERLIAPHLGDPGTLVTSLPWFEWFFPNDWPIDPDTATRLADLALDLTRDDDLRRSVVRLLVRQGSRVAAKRLFERGWSAANERDDGVAVSASALLSLCCREQGAYSNIRDRIVGGELAALLEVVHTDDMPKVIEDLSNSLRIACRLHATMALKRQRMIASGRVPKKRPPKAPPAGSTQAYDFLRTPSVHAMERLALHAPGMAEEWFSLVMTKSWSANGDIQAFAVMLLLAIGTEAPETAAVPMRRILDHLIDLSIESDEITAIGIHEITTSFRLPFHRDVAREMERLVRACHTDEKLAFVADRASRDLDWRRWLEEFCSQEAKTERPARRARARMLGALAGFTPKDVEGCSVPDATEALARSIEKERAHAEAIVAAWAEAPSNRRAALELQIPEAATGQVLDLPDLAQRGEIGVILAARIEAHQEEMIRRRDGTLFGCSPPPVHVVLSNVAPRVATAEKLRPSIA